MFGQTLARANGWLALGLVCAMLVIGCGGSSRTLRFDYPASLSPSSSDWQLADTLAELDAAAAPEGVDAALWEELKGELASQLADSGQKRASTPPEDVPQGRRAEGILPPQIGVTWTSSFFNGDGNGDGIVGIADLTPLAVHFGQEAEEPGAAVADYDRNGWVMIADVTALAAHFGESCGSFRIEVSTELPEGAYVYDGAVNYADFVGEDEEGFNVYRYVLAMPKAEWQWAKITVFDMEGNEGARSWAINLSDSWAPPEPIDDLALDPAAEPPDIGITWSTAFFKGDGNQDSVITILDLTPLGAHFGQAVENVPSAAVADYNRDGVVGFEDVAILGDRFLECVTGYSVEVSTEAPDVGFVLEEDITWVGGGVNQFGFSVFCCTLTDPPEARPFWVCVTPYDYDGNPGVPSAPLEIAE